VILGGKQAGAIDVVAGLARVQAFRIRIPKSGNSKSKARIVHAEAGIIVVTCH